MRNVFLPSIIAAIWLFARSAAAFTIESSITRGCHEQVTADAWRGVRAQRPEATMPLPSSGDDQALMDDLPFSLPADLADIGGATLLMGVRDNDLKSFAATALDQLAQLNADPSGQKEHCLRSTDDKEPDGSKNAVAACRSFIHDTLISALEGLDAQGLPDVNQREKLTITLAIRGKTQVMVPLFFLRAGRGIHAIQDSFTHTFRNQAEMPQITTVLNWINYADDNLDEASEGPPHLTELDRCDDPDKLRTRRHQLAIAASTEALAVLLDGSMNASDKSSALDAVLDKYVSFDESSDCHAANHWCNAPELAYRPSGCQCNVLGVGDREWSAWWWLGALLASWQLRRKRRLAQAASLCVAIFAGLGTARAESATPDQSSGTLRAPIDALVNAGAPPRKGAQDPAGAFFGRATFGASYDKPALVGGLGMRYQLSRPFMIGFDVEWNPWIVFVPEHVRGGAASAYFSLIRRFQMKNEALNLRSSVALGGSMLLIDLVGAPAGSVGPFFGISFLGIEWKLYRGIYLCVDPTYIAFPVPHVTGAPLGYYQYRFQFGLEFGG